MNIQIPPTLIEVSKIQEFEINEKTSMNQVETTGMLVSYAAYTLLVSCLRERVL